MKYLIIILLLSLISGISGQQSDDDLTAGFSMLDAGEYDQAVQFFDNMLSKNPDHKTAQICRGRALGLGGDVDKALIVFQKLNDQYPVDYEINMNLAECHMWRKEYRQAIALYEKALAEYSDRFLPNFGYANAHNAIGDPETANEYIGKAISIEPNNQSAINSQKYILLALAAKRRSSLKHDASAVLLHRILQANHDDRDARISLAETYLAQRKLKKAKDQYSLLWHKSKDTLNGMIGLSYVHLLQHKSKKALQLAKQAFDYSRKKKKDSDAELRAAIHLANIHAANQEFNAAETLLHDLDQRFGYSDIVTLNWSRLKNAQQDYKESLDILNQLPSASSVEFDKMMTMYGSHMGLRQFGQAQTSLDSALALIENQPDALRASRKLNLDGRAHLTLLGYYSQDNGGNKAEGLSAKVEKRLTNSWTSSIRVGQRSAWDDRTSRRHVQHVGLSNQVFITHKWSMNATIDLVQRDDADDGRIQSMLYDVRLLGKWRRNHEWQVGSSTRLEDFTAALITEGIRYTDYYTNYSYVSPWQIGAYTQIMYSPMSDGNLRQSIFASAYYNIKLLPSIKFGVNYLRMNFAERRELLYFSPENFRSTEAFFQFSNKYVDLHKWKINALVAIGRQTIDDNDSQNTLRADVQLGYHFTDRFSMSGQYQYSNAAQSTSAGFSFEKWSINVRYVF